MEIPSAYWIVQGVYLVAPFVAASLAVSRARRARNVRPLRLLLRTFTIGAFCGGGVATLYDILGSGRVPLSQMLLACYLGITALSLVHGLGTFIEHGLFQWLMLYPAIGRCTVKPAAWIIARLVQLALLVVMGLPFFGSLLLLYRPGMPSPGNPTTLIDAPFEEVHFRATDLTSLNAWWIPATQNRHSDRRGSRRSGRDTILLCPGFGADKASDLFLVRDLAANGYNVLAIDFRAQGRSGGRFTGLGGVESRDVLGAIRWLRSNHAGGSQRILGLGETLGAAALIEAAVDPSPEGQSIDAIAVFNPYTELSALLDDVAKERATPAVRWVLRHVILPLASAQLGVNLARVSPGQSVRGLWPRPILILGNSTTRRALEAGSFDVFQSAMQPRYSYFRDDEDRNGLLHDKKAALTVRIFFDEERPVL